MRPRSPGMRPECVWQTKSTNRLDRTRFQAASRRNSDAGQRGARGAQDCALCDAQPRAAKQWGGATCRAYASPSYCDDSNRAKGPDVASADNQTKWIRAFVRQIFFRKECARMDSRARLPDGTVQYRLERRQQSASRFRTLVTALDAIEGSHLLWVCRKQLRPELEQTNPGARRPAWDEVRRPRAQARVESGDRSTVIARTSS
jgi:hypothetical protein